MGMWVMYSDSWYYSEQLLCINYFNPNYGLKDIKFHRFRVITGQTNRRGKVTGSVCWRGVVDLRVAYPGLLYSSDQL